MIPVQSPRCGVMGIKQITGEGSGREMETLDTGGLFSWSNDTRAEAFANMANLIQNNVVRHGVARPLHTACDMIDPAYTMGDERGGVADYMSRNHVSGLLVIKNSKIVLERYAPPETESRPWTLFSVTKSITSTLVGMAVKDSSITSLEDMVVEYIPELAGTAYDGTRIADLLKMRSGLRWNETYTGTDGDDATEMAALIAEDKGKSLIPFMARLPHITAPNMAFNYNTQDTNALGIIVCRATGKSLSDYLSEKIWVPCGMEADAYWATDAGLEIGGAGCGAVLRDLGRFGLFMLSGGLIDGVETLPANWIKDATTNYSGTAPGMLEGLEGTGYGYQWWLRPDGSFEAIGIFGQSLRIFPQHDLVVVTLSAWPEGDWVKGTRRHDAFAAAVQAC